MLHVVRDPSFLPGGPSADPSAIHGEHCLQQKRPGSHGQSVKTCCDMLYHKMGGTDFGLFPSSRRSLGGLPIVTNSQMESTVEANSPVGVL